MRQEANTLKDSIVALEKEKIETAEKLRNTEKYLEESLSKKAVRIYNVVKLLLVVYTIIVRR